LEHCQKPGDPSALPHPASQWSGTPAAFHQLPDQLPTVIDSIPQKVWVASADGQVQALNRAWRASYGQPSHDDAAQWWYAVHPEDRAGALNAWAKSLRTGEDHEIEVRLKRAEGGYSWALVSARAERTEDGSIRRWFGAATDIDRWVADRKALRARELLVRQIVESSPDAIQLLDGDGRFIFVNQAACDALGVGQSTELIGRPWLDLIDAHLHEDAKRILAAAKRGERGSMIVEPRAGGGAQRWWEVESIPVTGESAGDSSILVVAREVTDRKRSEAQLLWAARHDVVTGLPNRGLLQSMIEESVKDAKLTGTRFTVFLLDVDNFKQTNDTLGHDAGDALLRELARRLVDTLRPTDFIARLGGDEFAVIRSGGGEEKEVRAVGDAILDALRAPFTFSERLVDCQASVGAAVYPSHGTTASELLKSADMALYGAKAAGRGVLRIFQAEFRQELQRRTSMISLARKAIDEDRIRPYYQPKVSLRTGEVMGFEALLRWRDPRGTIQTPHKIEAAFHDHSLAALISDRMIDHVLRDIRAWTDAELPFRHVAINAAAAEFRSGDFAERLLERLHRADLPSSAIQIEVTETVFLGRGAECVDRALKVLSREGVLIALDDFGTGYASLSHIKQFPVDILKIDRSFVRNLHTDPDDGAIVAAVINLGRSLNIKVVSEGVETQAQHNTLLALGCDYGQGFLYGRPSKASSVGRFMNRPLLPPPAQAALSTHRKAA